MFGDYNPSARLPVSFPYETGQQPYFYNHRNTGRPYVGPGKDEAFKARYKEAPNQALYAFGFGLGYSKFTYAPTQVSGKILSWDGKLTVTAKVTNIGARAGEEVAQLYIRDRIASITRPVRELKGIRKSSFAPGETKEVTFELMRRDLEFVGLDNKWTAEPGDFDVWIAPSATGGKAATFELMGQELQ